MSINNAAVGDMLRRWRRLRQRSQFDVACEAEISAKHLSFVETGRSAPSREMVLRLAEQLEKSHYGSATTCYWPQAMARLFVNLISIRMKCRRHRKLFS